MTIELDDISDEIEYWSSVIVCYVLGVSPPLEIFSGFSRHMWGKWGISKIASLGKGIYIVRFASVLNKEHVLENGVCMFDSKPVIMESWSPDLDVNAKSITHVSIWVKFPKLDLKYWGSEPSLNLQARLVILLKLIELQWRRIDCNMLGC